MIVCFLESAGASKAATTTWTTATEATATRTATTEARTTRAATATWATKATASAKEIKTVDDVKHAVAGNGVILCFAVHGSREGLADG